MRRGVFIGIIVVAILITVGVAVNYFSSTRELTVQYTNAEQVKLVDTTSNRVVRDNVQNNSTVRVKNDVIYNIEYQGADGYADGSVKVENNETKVTINPDYSDERNRRLIADAKPSVEQLLNKENPLLDSFFASGSISIRDQGTWLAVQLEYKGEYGFNSDNQIAVFKSSNQGQTWELVGGPALYLTTYNTDSIPVNILEWANSKTN